MYKFTTEYTISNGASICLQFLNFNIEIELIS